jgi:hypothetical protein
LPVTPNLHGFGTSVYSYPKIITPSIRNGFLNPRFSSKPKADSICTANPFRPSAINTYSLGIPHIKPCRRGSKLHGIPIRTKNHYNTKWAKDGFNVKENGKIELSMGNHDGKERNPLWCMRAIYLWDTSKK